MQDSLPPLPVLLPVLLPVPLPVPLPPPPLPPLPPLPAAGVLRSSRAWGAARARGRARIKFEDIKQTRILRLLDRREAAGSSTQIINTVP